MHALLMQKMFSPAYTWQSASFWHDVPASGVKRFGGVALHTLAVARCGGSGIGPVHVGVAS